MFRHLVRNDEPALGYFRISLVITLKPQIDFFFFYSDLVKASESEITKIAVAT